MTRPGESNSLAMLESVLELERLAQVGDSEAFFDELARLRALCDQEQAQLLGEGVRKGFLRAIGWGDVDVA